MSAHFAFGKGYVWCNWTSSVGWVNKYTLRCDQCKWRVQHVPNQPTKMNKDGKVIKVSVL
jgi:hypothetical protein